MLSASAAPNEKSSLQLAGMIPELCQITWEDMSGNIQERTETVVTRCDGGEG